MKFVLAAITALLATPALAHGGHVAEVDGHTHTLMDLAAMGVMPAVVAGVVLFAVYLSRRNG